MKLILNEEELYLKETAKNFAENTTPVNHFRSLRDNKDPQLWSNDVWKEMVELGWSGILIPEEYGGSDFGLYNALKDVAPGDYSAFLRLQQGHAIISLSPERFLSIDGRRLYSQPIKGTAPRFDDPQRDAESAQALLASGKDRAENIMITDLLRNDLGQFCEPGTVTVTELCGLHSYGNVHHLVSTVRGTLKDGTTPGQLLLASSPGGSITGAPKKRAVEIISELESHTRGAYCGSVFVLAGNGWMQSSIAIRTLEINDQHLHCWGGGGITASSQWEAEYQETLDKVGPIMEALGNGA